MAILDILKYPNPILKTKAEPVEMINDDIITLAVDMLQTMYTAPGIGLAAPQVGVLKRLIVLDVDYPTEEDEQLVIPSNLEEIMAHETCEVLVNPEIIDSSKETSECEEGCLSVPGFTENVVRPEKVILKAQLLNGDEVTFEAEDMFSTCIQHEIDHLDGKVFLDRLSSLKRNILKKKIVNKQKEEAAKK
jgi:peptide deformylase